MSTHADKTQENKIQSVVHVVSQKQSVGKSIFQFVDNRPEAIAQRKLQEMANNSPQVSQLRAFQDMANNSLQTKQAAQLRAIANNHSAEQQQPIQKKENNTGLPDNLKSGIENLSGYSMDDVKVHRNSDRPAQLQAHAYAQGTDIHLGPGQERHLPHETWHVVQQKQGRGQPTMPMQRAHSAPEEAGVSINDDPGLEREADVMGKKAGNAPAALTFSRSPVPNIRPVVQRVAAAPSAVNADEYDNAKIVPTAGPGASTAVEVKTTIANKNNQSSPTHPAQAKYMLQSYEGDYKNNGGLQSWNDSGGNQARNYIPTIWTAYFNWDQNKSQSLTQTHIIHHALATDANDNEDNIAWANAFLNNSTWYPAFPKPRSVADREHEDRDTLNAIPYGSGNKKINNHLYGSNVKVRAYNGGWYTTDNSIGVLTAKVSATDLPGIQPNTFPSAVNIWKLLPGKMAMWYRSVPNYDTARPYADNIRDNLQDAYDKRVDPQHTGEELHNPNWFDDVGDEIAHSYASSFTISSLFYTLDLHNSTGQPVRTDIDLDQAFSWAAGVQNTETIHDPSALSGGMQVRMTYVKAKDAMEPDPTAADAVEGNIEVNAW